MKSSIYFNFDKVKPFENIPVSGGMTSILQKVVVVGDSLSSGETELLHENNQRSYHDKYESSWPQFIARDAGIKVTNYTHGGETAKNFLNVVEKYNAPYYSEENSKANAYILALGVNDVVNCKYEVGKVEDTFDENSESFAHYYGTIISKYKELEPNARFFLLTMPKDIDDDDYTKEVKRKHAELLHEFEKEVKHCFVVDFYNEVPTHDKEFKKQYYLNGHLNAAGYRLTALLVESAIDAIIRNNMDEFRGFALIGYPEYEEKLTHIK